MRRRVVATSLAFFYSVFLVIGCSKHAPFSPSIDNIPVIISMTASPEILQPNANSVMNVSATDADSEKLTYSWTGSAGIITGDGNIVNWKAPIADGVYSVSVSVSDGRGGVATQTKSITVETPIIPPPLNNDPVIFVVSANPTSIPLGSTSELTVAATDPDGDTLHYSWSGLGIPPNLDFPSITMGGCCIASHTINIIVSDGKGGTASGSVTVDVY